MEWSKQEIQKANELDIVEVAQKLGLDVVAKGRFLRTRCLWHNDDTPSLQLGGREAYRSRCKCYSCGAMHGVVDLVMEAASKTFSEAMEWIFESFGLAKDEGLRAKDKRLKAKVLACHPSQAQNDGSGENPQPSTLNPQPKSYATLSKVRKHVSTGNALCLCLKDYFPSEVVDQVTMMYQLGTDYAVDSRCHTLFPSIDRWGRVHDVKLQVYDINRHSPRYGHSQGTYWVGKRLLLREDGTEYGRDTECLFGEHLLALRTSATVGLVESPKNAIVCACHWPDQVWVATGNKGMLKRSILRPLQGRQVLVYPDRDAHEEWTAILATMQNLATFRICDVLHDFPMEKGDIADYVLIHNS